LLQDIYGEGSMTNLSFLASESDAARELLVETTMQPFFNSVKKFGPMGIVFESNPWKTQSYFFWKFVMKDLLHSVGRGMFSDKSAMSFLERIQMDSVRAGWLQCRKDYAVFLASNGRVFVFHPESFPWAKKDQYKVAGTSKYNIIRFICFEIFFMIQRTNATNCFDDICDFYCTNHSRSNK